MYFAIIGDIKNSKQLVNRYETQEKLKEVLDLINKKYYDNLSSLFSITIGDEFQGLLMNSQHMLEIIDTIRFSMHPIEIRFGIGYGGMKTAIVRESSTGSDGPAYWAAREAIDYIHDHNDYGISKIYIKEIREYLPISNVESHLIQSANSMLALCDRYEKTWIDSQYDFVRKVILTYGYNLNHPQKKMAEDLGLSPQLLNNKMKTTGIKTYIQSRITIEESFMKRE